MAAVRCLARRLGGSLLQRTQAVVAEERRLRLVPSRLTRSRLLSSEASGENACETELDKEMRRLISAMKKKTAELKANNKPSDFQLTMESYTRVIDGVMAGAAKLLFLSCIPYSVYYGLTNEKRIEAAQARTKENQ